MMDRPAINAAEDFCHAGYPRDVEALLICELDGPAAEVEHLMGIVMGMARQHGATHLKESVDDEERLKFWAGRKNAFPAVGRISPDYICMDGTIPRNQIAHVLRRMTELSDRHGLKVANVFHAGDGNLHPLILFDGNNPGELERCRGVRRRHPAPVRRGRRRAHGRARGRRREARPHAGNVQRGRPTAAAAPQMRPSTPRRSSTPARSSRPCTAVPNWAGCTSIKGRIPFPELERF